MRFAILIDMFTIVGQLTEALGSEDGKLVAKYKKILDDFAHKVIDERRKQYVASGGLKDAGRMDLLDFFMQVEMDGQPPSTEYLRDVILNYIIAGRE